MLSIIASSAIRPEVEALDRDPGIVSLVSAIARAARGACRPLYARIRPAFRSVADASLSSSSSAWPHHPRSP